MRDRPLRPLKPPRPLRATPSRWQSQPLWVLVSLLVNGFLIAILVLTALRNYSLSSIAPPVAPPPQLMVLPVANPAAPHPAVDLGQRHQLNYQQWLDLLKQEARAAAQDAPKRLTVLAGDSLSLWFPPELLPISLHDGTPRSWLNQGISGETSAGLLRRLDLFEQTQPETIFVLIGINDLIRQVKAESVLANQQQIVRDLRRQHPHAQIVLQSILPHGIEQVTWEGRDRLLAVSNRQIRDLNDKLRTIAREENIHFLDLHPLFADAQGNLLSTLSTDGLHLSAEGYLVWRTALQLYSQTELE